MATLFQRTKQPPGGRLIPLEVFNEEVTLFHHWNRELSYIIAMFYPLQCCSLVLVECSSTIMVHTRCSPAWSSLWRRGAGWWSYTHGIHLSCSVVITQEWLALENEGELLKIHLWEELVSNTQERWCTVLWALTYTPNWKPHGHFSPQPNYEGPVIRKWKWESGSFYCET